MLSLKIFLSRIDIAFLVIVGRDVSVEDSCWSWNRIIEISKKLNQIGYCENVRVLSKKYNTLVGV